MLLLRERGREKDAFVWIEMGHNIRVRKRLHEGRIGLYIEEREKERKKKERNDRSIPFRVAETLCHYCPTSSLGFVFRYNKVERSRNYRTLK